MVNREDGERMSTGGIEMDRKRKNSAFHGGQLKHVLEKMMALMGCR